ncbi:MAG: N-acetylmuramoyl-L-alanine amidase, partial [Sandaracinaceae bacterium]
MTRHLCLLVGSLLCAPVASAQVVVVDPGHGGRDPGAVGCESLEEAPTVLDVAQRVQGILEAEGLSVALTREDDRFVELSARAAFANSMGAELYVSVHSNSNGGTPASGTETFVANSASGTSVTMGGFLQEEMILAWGLRDRGLKRANFTVLTATRMPAALTEIAFTNRCDPDAMLLRDPTSRMAMAQAHANAVLRTLDREPGMSGTLTGVVFEDVGVGLEDTTRRLGGATVTAGEMTQTSAADTGAWSFTLPPGTYTVQVSLDGWRSAERSCDVTPRGTTWCSVGVVREAAPADAGAPEPDAAVTV